MYNDGSGSFWTQITAGTLSNVFAGIILLFLLPFVLVWSSRMGLEPLATPTPVVPTSTPIPVMIVTRSPEEKKFSPHINQIKRTIYNMTNSSGHNTMVLQYWDDIDRSGSTGGCLNFRFPDVPEDYVLPHSLINETPSELVSAMEIMNTGLALSRQAWEGLEKFCAGEAVDTRLYFDTAKNAERAFEEADRQIAAADLKIKGLDQP